MRIAIDCRMIDVSGIGVYIRGVLPHIVARCREILCLVNRENRPLLERILGPSGGRFAYIPDYDVSECDISKCDTTSVYIYEWNTNPFSAGEFFTPAALRAAINARDAYWTPFFNVPAGITIPAYTTIHDIIFPDMPELTSRAGLAARMFFYRRAFRRSAAVFTVSEFSASRIRHYAARVAPRLPVVVTHSALRPCVRAARAAAKTKTILFVGNIKKHKGLSILLEAFTRARARGLDYRLVIAGSRERFRTRDRSARDGFAGDAVSFTGPVSDERLLGLYAESAALVQPSLYEGFCLPPLEAMCLGARALVSDIPVFREIYADFPVVFFRAGDPESLAAALLDLPQDAPPPPLVLSAAQKDRYTFQKTAAAIMRTLGSRPENNK